MKLFLLRRDRRIFEREVAPWLRILVVVWTLVTIVGLVVISAVLVTQVKHVLFG